MSDDTCGLCHVARTPGLNPVSGAFTILLACDTSLMQPPFAGDGHAEVVSGLCAKHRALYERSLLAAKRAATVTG